MHIGLAANLAGASAKRVRYDEHIDRIDAVARGSADVKRVASGRVTELRARITGLQS